MATTSDCAPAASPRNVQPARVRSLTAAIAVVVLAAGCAPSLAAEKASWEDQARVMMFYIMHLSSTNAINGLNLTRDQAVKLRDLARSMEAIAPVPKVAAEFRPDFAEVRDVFMELDKVLTAGEEPSPALQSKVMKARTTETLVLRQSLVNPTRSSGTCLKCHGEPAIPDVRKMDPKTIANEQTRSAVSPHEQFMAHHAGVFGPKGVTALVKMAPQVDAILHDDQKQIMQTFACCLIPPKGLSDPVRAGQAAGGEKEIDTLRKARAVPASNWPKWKDYVLNLYDKSLISKSPGASEDKKAARRENVSEIFEKARKLSDTDFEIQKDQLAVDLAGETNAQDKADAKGRQYMIASFLTVPGSVAVYDRVIKQLDSQPKVTKK